MSAISQRRILLLGVPALLVAIFVYVLASSTAPVDATPTASPLQQPDFESIAQQLVVDNAAVQEGEHVMISGNVRDLELMENIAVHVRKLGAFPLVVLESDRVARRMVNEVPETYDTQSPSLSLDLVSTIDVMIDFDNGEAEDIYANLSAERIARRAETGRVVPQKARERGVRVIEVGNGLYPTKARAKRHGMTQAELSEKFWAGVSSNPSLLTRAAAPIQARLSSGEMMRITHANGTDVSFRITGRPHRINSGQISEADRAARQTLVWLPAGEIFLAPEAGTATGTVVMPSVVVDGKTVKNVRLTFKNGRLTSMDGDAGIERMRSIYDAAPDGKEEFGFVDIGLNPGIAGGSTWTAAGTVTLGIGQNVWAGGDNDTPFAFSGHLPGATVDVDGQAIVKDGVLISSNQ